MSNYFPAGDRGIILIATKNPGCARHATVGSIRLGALEIDEATTLLFDAGGTSCIDRKRFQANAYAIVETLGLLALAIVHTAALIRERVCTFDDYCSLYKQHRHQLLNRQPTQGSSDYDSAVHITWELSVDIMLQKKQETASKAMEILNIFACYHFNHIPKDLFKHAWTHTLRTIEHRDGLLQLGILDGCKQQLFDYPWDLLLTRKALATLEAFSLIQRASDNNIGTHPLVQAWTRDRLTTEERHQWLSKSNLPAWKCSILRRE